MREILFRGKRTDNGEWIMGYYFFEGGKVFADFYGCHYIHPCNKNQAFSVIPETVGQYTGLTDKNGKKIFEGDIFKFGETNYIVKWDEENARFLGFAIAKEQYIAYVGREPKIEIIGNVHDNPELLKKEE